MHVLKNETEHGEQSRTNKNTNTDARSGARETRHHHRRRHHQKRRSGAEKIRHGAETIHGAELQRSTGGALKRAETLKSGRRAVLNATAEIVGTWYKCELRFCAEIFQSIKCDFQKCAEILKNIFKKSHLI